MEPSKKSPAIDRFLSSITGKSRVGYIRKNLCVACGEPADEFRDQVSTHEFSISGLCQKCQDEVWGYFTE